MAKSTLRTCEKGHSFYKSSDCPTCPICEAARKPANGFLASLGAPARRALEAANIHSLQQLAQWSEKELLQLHGFGPSSLPKLKQALKTAIATAFSSGNFEETFPFLGENASWNVIEENQFNGKAAILKQCRDVATYFKSVTTNFNILQVIEDENTVAVSGTAEFLRNGKRISFIHGCDIYVFNKQDLLESITSYCIKSK